MGEQADLDWAQNDAVEAEDCLRAALSDIFDLRKLLVQRLEAWREKDERLDRGTWHGVSEIANSLGIQKPETRPLLASLAEDGTIERLECSNGIFWRGKLHRAPAPALSQEEITKIKIEVMTKALQDILEIRNPNSSRSGNWDFPFGKGFEMAQEKAFAIARAALTDREG